MKKQLLIWALLPITSLLAENVFETNFAGKPDGTPLSEAGWRIHDNGGKSSYLIKDGKLVMTGYPAEDLQGGYAEIDLPLVDRGTIEFDLNVTHGERGISLFMDIYNISLFWHDYTGDWRRYFPEPTARRMMAYSVEPVGHRRLGEVKKSKLGHYKIFFDKNKDRVEYYKDDMEDPVFIDGEAAVWGRQEYLGGKFRIGNWGVARAPMTFEISNIVIKEMADSADLDVERDRILLFNGLSFNRYKFKEALLGNGWKKEDIREYTIENPKPALTPANKFFASKLPSSENLSKAKYIVLVDFPFGPDGVVPEYVVKDFLTNVENGATLVVFGGLLSLGKGHYMESSLGEELPVKLAGPWQFKKLPEPTAITAGNEVYSGINFSAAPLVSYLHQLAVTEDSETLLMAGDQPLLVSRSFGKGRIIVFLGSTCGKLPDGEQRPLFWHWQGWPKLIDQIISK